MDFFLGVQLHFTIDQLKKYKDLLDTGAISQDEFETKKNQLLNL